MKNFFCVFYARFDRSLLHAPWGPSHWDIWEDEGDEGLCP